MQNVTETKFTQYIATGQLIGIARRQRTHSAKGQRVQPRKH